MEKDFVPYNIAVSLKERGFNEEVIAYWVKHSDPSYNFLTPYLKLDTTTSTLKGEVCNQLEEIIARPMWYQVDRWLYQNYKITTAVYLDNTGWHWKIRLNGSESRVGNFSETPLLTEEAATQALMERVFYKIDNPNSVEETVGERSLRLLNEMLNSEAGNKYFEEMRLEDEIFNQRLDKAHAYLSSLDEQQFAALLNRMFAEHSDDYRDKCYAKGYEPDINNKMHLFVHVAEKFGTEIPHNRIDDDVLIGFPGQRKGIDNSFEAHLHFYRDYFVQLNSGQGSFWRIYNKDKQEIFTS